MSATRSVRARVEELRTQLGEVVDLLNKAHTSAGQSSLTAVMGSYTGSCELRRAGRIALLMS